MTSTLNPASCRPSTVRHTQRGFTLVELMIAVVISLLILIALVAVFLNTSRTNTEMARTNSIIENGRFAMQVLQDDVVHAGYWGQYVPQYDDLTATGIPTDVPTEAPAVCTAYAAWDTQYRTNLIGVPVQAFSDVPPGCDAVVADRKADTDVLVVRRVETCVAGSTGCAADVAGTLYFQSSLCASDPAATPYVLDTTGHTLRTRACSTILSPKRRFVSSIYYVRTYSEVIDDNIPTLVRSRFDSSPGALAHQDPVPLVEGIEGFKVQLGIDARSRVDLAANYLNEITWVGGDITQGPSNRGDGVPDETCSTTCTTAQLINAVTIELHLLARSQETTPGYTDTKNYTLGTAAVTLSADDRKYKRHAYSTTVRLNNVSGRREAP